MSIDFTLSPEVEQIRLRVRQFITTTVKPAEGALAELTGRDRLKALLGLREEAKAEGLFVRGYISTCFGCPYEGPVAPSRVAEVTRRLIDLGCDEISLGDTIGVGVPTQVDEVLEAVLRHTQLSRLAVHFHDTRGTALANVLRALELGVATVDSSAGGLGGCPYAPGASGNLATEDLLYMLHGMNVETGVDLVKVAAASRFIGERLGRELPSRYLKAVRTTT